MKRLIFITAFLLVGCQTKTPVTPNISYTTLPKQIAALPSPFKPLDDTERASDWGKELFIAKGHLKELDLFNAVTCLKRSRILLQDQNPDRLQEIEYGLIFAYCLGNKFQSAIETFETSHLKVNPQDFKPYDDLLLLLADSYNRQNEPQRGQTILTLLKDHNPEKAKKFDCYSAFLSYRADALPDEFTNALKPNLLSPQKAALFNGLLPGAGYAYVGQYQTALTSFCLNALFIIASAEFFSHGQPAAGVITAGFECGWYVGGIIGARNAAIERNSLLYNGAAKEHMIREKFFPLLMFEYGF